MRSRHLPYAISAFAVVAAVSVCASSIIAQDTCLTSDDVRTIVTKINSPQSGTPNKHLADELLKLRSDNQNVFQQALEEKLRDDIFKKRIGLIKEKTTPRFCRILKEV